MYYKTTSPSGQEVIILLEGNVMTSMLENPDSSDYQRFLKWISEGNQPEPWNN